MERISKFKNIPKKEPEEEFSFLGEKLMRLLEISHPELLAATLNIQQEKRRALERRERAIAKKGELQKTIHEYGISCPIEKEKNESFYSIPVQEHFSSEIRIPKGYAYKGSAARALLLKNMGIDSEAQPRDIDIVRISDIEPDDSQDKSISKLYMSEDFEHGYGVEVLNSPETYFQTRDFTINEVLATDTKITATKQCILDTIRHIIRITPFEHFREDGNKNKILAKALRFYAEAIKSYSEASLEEGTEAYLEEYFVSPFWIALQLDRAFEKGEASAESYCDTLKEREQIPHSIQNAKEAAEYLLSLFEDGRTFYYRHAPINQIKKENEWSDYEILPKFLGIHKT